MKVGIIGASGKAGSFLMAEALNQGHQVTAMVRDRSKLAETRAEVVERDLFSLTPYDLSHFDVVIDAFKAPPGQESQHISSLEHLIGLVGPLPEPRLMVVGGAGSLYTDASRKIRLMDTEDFPPAFLPTASAMGEAFAKLRDSLANWAYLSPAAVFDPRGKRTGKYTLGWDVMIVNKSGESYVSYPDFAIAMIDEIRNKNYMRQRFSVVSEKQ